ncbi:MAG: type VI secretion system membrane subunit TssM [bacterium]
MNIFSGLLKNKGIAVVIGVILLIILIFTLGSKLGLASTEKIFISVFLVLVLVIYMLYLQMKAIKNAGQIEQSIRAQANAQLQGVRPEKKAEIEQLKKQLEAAINSLNKSKLGRGGVGKSALYALPWYMMIGPSAAGKTTAIQNSGLEFPFGKDELKGVGGTRNCDWFFSNKAIFLDTAGRYTTQVEDREEWLSFLDVLKVNRKKKPINGIVIGINVDELINGSKDKIDTHARNIRQRIDELIAQLGVRFPVYLVFTKCDLIQGFIEFFGDFSQSERNQIWGCTLTHEQQISSDLRTIFKSEFKILTDKLSLMRKMRLSTPLKREQRRKVYLFPLQFASLEEKLSYFVSELFQANPYQDTPIFRGFYFTSGTQEGMPLDVAIKKIAEQFGLPPVIEEKTGELVETKNYFIKDFFSGVLIHDQNLMVARTATVVRKNRYWRYALMAVIALALTGFVIGVTNDFIDSKSQMAGIENISKQVENINWQGDILENLKLTDTLRSHIEAIQQREEDGPFISFGMNRGSDLLQPALKLYNNKMSSFYNQYIFGELLRRLDAFNFGQEFPRETIYNSLKAYLLIGDEKSRLDTLGQKFLIREFTSIADSKILQLIPTNASVRKDELRSLLYKHIRFYVENIGKPDMIYIKNDESLVQSIRQKIMLRPSIEGVYARIKQQFFDKMPASLNLTQLIGSGYPSNIQSTYEIPEFFTKKAWTSYVKNEIELASENPGKEDWVLGGAVIGAIPSEMQDKEQMIRNLKSMYFADYSRMWMEFLKSISFTDFGDVSTASQVIYNLSIPNSSPLLQLFKNVYEETKFEPAQLGSDTTSSGLSPMDTEFSELHNFVYASPDKKAPGKISICLQQYGIINGILESLKGDEEASKNYAAQIIKKGSGEYPNALREIQNSLYPNLTALKNIFEAPVRLAWHSVLKDAGEYLNNQWKLRVYDPYKRTLASFYPFNNGGMDAPVEDFEEFFNPQSGIIWSFYTEELSDFINKDPWRANKWEDAGVNISNEMINFLSKADDIGEAMFNNGVLNLSFQLKPILPVSKTINDRKPIVEQVYIYINGIENYYQMGSPFYLDFSWPVSQGTVGVKLNATITGIGTADEINYDGEWALFRLLDKAIIEKKSTRQYQLSWNFKRERLFDISIIYELRASSTKNPFQRNYFGTLNLPAKIN